MKELMDIYRKGGTMDKILIAIGAIFLIIVALKVLSFTIALLFPIAIIIVAAYIIYKFVKKVRSENE